MTVGLLSFVIPQTNGGKASINTWLPSSQTEMMFIDYCKSAQGGQQGFWVPVSTTETDWFARFDANGVPQSMPAGVSATWSNSQLYIEGIAGATVVLDNISNCTCSLVASFSGGGLTQTLNTASRQEYLITGTPISSLDGVTAGGAIKVNISIAAISGALTAPRLYLKTNETLLNGTGATSIFHPNYLTRVQRFGVHRHMDTLYCNSSRLYDFNYRTKLTDQNWCGGLQKGTWYYGTATKTFNRYTVPNSIGTPAHGQVFQFYMPTRPSTLVYTPTNVTAGSVTTFGGAAHGFSGGELVFIDAGTNGVTTATWVAASQTRDTTTGLPPVFTVTVIDASTFSINMNSTGFSTPGGNISVMPQIQLSDGVTTKRVLRGAVNNSFNSEFGANGATVVSFVYDANYGVMNFAGDSEFTHAPGIPFEAIFMLSNYCRQHPYLNLPFFFSDASWTALAGLVKSNLNGVLIPRFAVGNEIWNATGNIATSYAQSEAARLVLNSGVAVNSNTNYHLAYGLRTKQVSALLAAVFGNNATWQMILESQMSNLDTNRTQGNATVQALAPTGFPANYCDDFATAPYTTLIFEGSSSPVSGYSGALDQIDNFNQGGASAQTAFNWLLAELETPSTPGYGSNSPFQLNRATVGLVAIMTAQAATMSGFTGKLGAGLVQTHYEGSLMQINELSFSSSGFPTTAPTSGRAVTFANMQAFWTAFLQSSQAGQYITDHMTAMAGAGVKWPNHYTVAGVWQTPPNELNYGAWQINNLAAPALPMWTALSAFNAP